MKSVRFSLAFFGLLLGLFFAWGHALAAGDAAAAPAPLPPWLTEALTVFGILLPSIITVLTRYKQFGWLSSLLDLLSIFTHKDSPGLLQLPLVQQSKPPVAPAAPDDKVTP